MSGRPHTLEEQILIEQAVEERRAALEAKSYGKYHNIHFDKEGGTGFVYEAERQIPGEEPEKIAMKTDKPRELMTSHRAWRHKERKNDVLNEIRMRRILGGIPGVNVAFDWIDLREEGFGYAKVELYLEGRTLEEVIEPEDYKPGNPIAVPQFRRVFRNIMKRQKQVLDRGVYLRDAKASNILVDEETDNIHLIDHGNAAHKSELEAKTLPTAGGQKIMDPITVAGFTPETPQYQIQSELYALGVNMLLTLGGRYQFDYDMATWEELEAMGLSKEDVLENDMMKISGGPLKLNGVEGEFRFDHGYWNFHDELGVRRGVRLDGVVEKNFPNGPTLLDVNGNLNVEAHEDALTNAIHMLPYDDNNTKSAREYAPIIRKLLTVKKKDRYNSIEEVIEDFEKVGQPGWTRRNALRLFGGAALVGLGALAGIGGLVMNKANPQVQQLVDPRPVMESEWDYKSLTLMPTHFNLSVNVSSLDRSIYYDDGIGVRAVPGEELNVSMEFLKNAATAKLYTNKALEGRVYLQGEEGKTFTVNPRPFDQSDIVDMIQMKTHRQPSVNVTIPEDIGPGTRSIIIELYAPEEDDPRNSIRFPEPGKAILYYPIPVAVGEQIQNVTPHTLRFYTGSIHFKLPFYDSKTKYELPSPISYDVSILEKEFSRTGTFDSKWSEIEHILPGTTGLKHLKEGDLTFQFVLRDTEDAMVYSGWLPFNLKYGGDGPLSIPHFELRAPDQDFHKKLIEYRKNLDKESR